MAYSFSSITTTPSTLPSFSFFAKTSQISINRRFKVSCNANIDGDHQNPLNNNNSKHEESGSGKFDRRNMLIGLGGLYGVATTPLALASSPSLAPDLNTYHDVELPKVDCSLPRKIMDFKPKHLTRTMRVRPAADSVTKEYIDKYCRAIELMKGLPDDDPRSFKNQAKVHCAYCDGAYEQVGFPNLDFLVHSSWLFFPFHRLYLYFFEKILGKLIDDPTFALPFWNWDSNSHGGMEIPHMYVAPNTSSLYDKYRDEKHLPPKIVDFDYNMVDNDKSPAQQVHDNLKTMYRQMVTNATTAQLFLGTPFRAGGEPEPGAGTIEMTPHNHVHLWVGDRTRDNLEDMGIFYSAARDPIIYAHHANVDRMWTIWAKFHDNFTDQDWLDTSFIFCDENADLVRVKVRDSLYTKKLGYKYEPVPIPWLNKPPMPRLTMVLRNGSVKSTSALVEEYADENFPRALNKVIKVMVSRPKKPTTVQEKEKDQEEVLVIQGIELGSDEFVKFDVFINEYEDEAESGPQYTEFAGSFVNVPHGHKRSKKKKTQFRIGISELLKGLEAENDEKVLVTLVPKNMSGTVIINGIKIELETYRKNFELENYLNKIKEIKSDTVIMDF